MLPAWSPQPQSVPGLQSLHGTPHETTDTHAHTHMLTHTHAHTHLPSMLCDTAFIYSEQENT